MLARGPAELTRLLRELDTPETIQEHINNLRYNSAETCNSPLNVLKTGRAHCFEGALFAAACLQANGEKPLLMDLRAVNDHDHTLTIFKRNGLWGALAKSNFTPLRYREPVYRSLRELAMTYFDFYFNVNGEKTLREYSRPFDLTVYDGRGWVTADEDLEYIGNGLDRVRHYPVITNKAAGELGRVDGKLIKASLLGASRKEVYEPEKPAEKPG